MFQYGEDAIKENGMGGGGGMADIFDMFGGGGSRRRQEVKGDDIVHKLQVKLEDLYKGATRYDNAVCAHLFNRRPFRSFQDLYYLLGEGQLRKCPGIPSPKLAGALWRHGSLNKLCCAGADFVQFSCPWCEVN